MTTRTHCKSGRHAWTEENIYTPPRSYSARNTPALCCKLCRLESSSELKRRESARFVTTGSQQKPHKPADRIEHYEELREVGFSFIQVASRFGIKPMSLERFLKRHNMPVPDWRERV